ncbi:MAG: glycosyl hydrolase family 28-related protein [Solirubrobacteraceae bacterium]
MSNDIRRRAYHCALVAFFALALAAPASLARSRLPVVQTTGATGISGTAATLTGVVRPEAYTTKWSFQYGPTGSYRSVTTAETASGSTTLAAQSAVSDLQQGTTYHYRLVATNRSGIGFGSDAVFTTTAPPSSATVSAHCAVSGATGATGKTVYNAAGSPYNAVGRAQTDDTTALQSAINAASAGGGGIVTLPSGTFLINGHLVMKSNVALEGAGMAATVIKAGPNFMSTTDDGGYPVIATDGARNVTIEDLEVDQSADTLYAAGRVNENTPGRLSAYLLDVLNSTNVIVQNVATRHPFTYSLVANASNHFCFRHDNVEQNPDVNGDFNQLDGIHILDSSYGDVLANYVDQRYNGATDGDDGLVAHSINASTHDITYADNVVRGGNNGNDMQIAPGPEIFNIQILNNEFYGGPFGIRSGVYSSGANTVANITIEGNKIHNNVGGNAYPDGGEAIDIGGTEAGGGLVGASDVTIENNEQCNASDSGADGAFFVRAGTGNVIVNNTTYTGCTDGPSSNPANG